MDGRHGCRGAASCGPVSGWPWRSRCATTRRLRRQLPLLQPLARRGLGLRLRAPHLRRALADPGRPRPGRLRSGRAPRPGAPRPWPCSSPPSTGARSAIPISIPSGPAAPKPACRSPSTAPSPATTSSSRPSGASRADPAAHSSRRSSGPPSSSGRSWTPWPRSCSTTCSGATPTLQAMSIENGSAWVPYLLRVMDKAVQERHVRDWLGGPIDRSSE